jgi:hypothetical protein
MTKVRDEADYYFALTVVFLVSAENESYDDEQHRYSTYFQVNSVEQYQRQIAMEDGDELGAGM